jgi:16S rRNA (cytosine967-C5)-methyltransferase
MKKETEQKQPKTDAGLASRKLAVEILIRVESEGAYANLALASGFNRKQLSERDRAFVTALVQGVLRHRLKLDEWIARISTQKLEKMPVFLRNALRISLFQLVHMSDIRESAVVDTCVKLVRSHGHEGQVKFANALLRNFLRKRDSFADIEVVPLNLEQLPTSYSMPMWLVEKWLNAWGPDETRQLLEHSQQIPDLVIRVCEQSITTEGLQEILQAQGVKLRRGRLVESCLIVEDRGPFRGPLSKLPGYSDGLFTVQDEAAAFVSKVVDPKPGYLVIDLCAAPGGKSIHLAELMENKGRVIAVDSHSARLNLLRRNRQRLGITNIETFVADGRSFQNDTKADCVLLDAPCTGTGVINRRSDIRFHREAPDMVQLSELQRQLLEHASTLVKPGGTLVYSTCSMEPEENEQNIQAFLERHEDFHPSSLSPYVSTELLADWRTNSLNAALDLDRGWLTLMPSRHGTSGFFVCRMLRDSSPMPD